MALRIRYNLLILCLLVTGCSPVGNIVFINGHIITLDEQDRIAEAVAVEDGIIVAVGSNADVKPFIDKDFKVLDLQGKTMTPGFIDAHGHFPGSGLKEIEVDLNSPPIGQITTIEQLKFALGEKLETTKSDGWVSGFGYDDTLLQEHRHPTRLDLDEVSTETPIFIRHISGHLAVVNSAALAIANINATTPDPVGGIIGRDPISGEPNGILEETAMELILAVFPQPSIFDSLKMTLSATDEYASKGVTTAQNGLAEKAYFNPLRLASLAGLLKQRIVMWPSLALGKEILAGTYKPSSNNRFKVGAIKMVADGSIQGYTGYLREPYFTAYEGDASYRGYPRTPLQQLKNDVLAFHKAGYQIAIHGNGDAAIDDIIEAIAAAQAEFPRNDARHIIVHAQMVQDDQLDQMQQLGITPSYFSLHTYYWGDRHREIFMGPERASRMSPSRSTLDRGIPFTLHADTPVVPMDPMLLMWSAVNRTSYLGTSIGEYEKISALDALKAVTVNAAWQIFEEEHRGSIATGKVADLVVLSEDPLTHPESLNTISVLNTFLNGAEVYNASN